MSYRWALHFNNFLLKYSKRCVSLWGPMKNEPVEYRQVNLRFHVSPDPPASEQSKDLFRGFPFDSIIFSHHSYHVFYLS